MVALKRSTYNISNVDRDIFQRDLLCDGTETSILDCDEYVYDSRGGEQILCPLDHTQDAAVICNGTCTYVRMMLHFTEKSLQKYKCIYI